MKHDRLGLMAKGADEAALEDRRRAWQQVSETQRQTAEQKKVARKAAAAQLREAYFAARAKNEVVRVCMCGIQMYLVSNEVVRVCVVFKCIVFLRFHFYGVCVIVLCVRATRCRVSFCAL